MAVNVEWDNEAKSILRFEYVGRWTWQELYLAVDKAYTMVDSVPHLVGAIIDMTRSEAIPPGAIAHGRNIQQRSHPRVEMNVTVNAGGFLTTLAKTFFKVYGTLIKSSTHFTGSVDEARALIAEKMPRSA